MPKKKVLVFIDWYLPGTRSGGPVRSIANLVAHLEEEFQFLIVTRDTDYCETEAYKNVQSNKWNKLSEQVSVFYISEENINKKFLKNLIASTDFDTAYINGIYSRFFSILPVWLLRNSGKPVLVAARGMLNSQAFSVKPIRKKIFLSLVNFLSFYKNVEFHATNKDEATAIRKVIRKYSNIKVAPNLPRKIKTSGFKMRTKKEPVSFISVARVAQEKGTLTALVALSKLKEEQVIVYDIYGPVYDREYWKDCEAVIAKLPDHITVNYQGSLNGNEVPALLEAYHFFIMPSEGENFGHGILEALTAGCPVIISNKTPWKDLRTKKIGWDCSLDSIELNAALEEAIAMDQETYQRWSKNAFDFASEHCNGQETIKANRKLFL